MANYYTVHKTWILNMMPLVPIPFSMCQCWFSIFFCTNNTVKMLLIYWHRLAIQVFLVLIIKTQLKVHLCLVLITLFHQMADCYSLHSYYSQQNLKLALNLAVKRLCFIWQKSNGTKTEAKVSGKANIFPMQVTETQPSQINFSSS